MISDPEINSSHEILLQQMVRQHAVFIFSRPCFFPFFLLFFFIFPLVPLGSIPELPAESCAEIKRSEGAAMRSGGFWIQSSVNSGKASLVNCDVGESNGEYLSKLPL